MIDETEYDSTPKQTGRGPKNYLGYKGEQYEIIKYLGRKIGQEKTNHYWLAKCECGNEWAINSGNIKLTDRCKSCSSSDNAQKAKYKKAYDGDLYMIAAGPYVKIGSTNNIDVRLRGLQSCNPVECKLVGYWPGMAHLEEQWHKELAHLHVRGEWFLLGKEETPAEQPSAA